MCHASNHYDFDSYSSQKYYTEFSFYSQSHRVCILHIYFVVVVFLFLMKNLHQSALILWVNNFRSRFQVIVVFLKAFALLKVKNGRYANCTVRTIGIIINLVFQFELTLTFNTCDQWAHFIYMEFSMKISQSVFKLSREKNIFFLDYHRHRHQLRIESTVPKRHNAIYVSVYMLVDIYESKNRL